MTVQNAKLHWTGSTGGRSLEQAEYTAVWLVETDDKNDQVKTVLDYFEANHVARGTLYNYAGDSGSIAYADRISARRWDPTEFAGTGRFYWEVTVNYRTEDDTTSLDEGGEPTTNPLDFRPVISARTVQYIRPVTSATFYRLLGDVGGTAFTDVYPEGTEDLLPMNSAKVPLNPPMEMDDARYVINIVKNVSSYNATNDANIVNSINTVPFKINKFGFLYDPIPKYWAKLRDIQVQLRRQSGIDYIEVSVAMDLNKDTWLHLEVDRGIMADAKTTGVPDGRGGTIDANTPIPTGAPKYRALVDFEERPITEPVLFDGSGQPQDPDLAPVFLEWGKFPEKNFLTEVSILQGIIEAT